MWVGILSIAFVIVGFVFFGIDNILKKKTTYSEEDNAK